MNTMAHPFPIGITFVESFFDKSKEDARRLIRHEMESMLDPLVESLFTQLKAKFADYAETFKPKHQLKQYKDKNTIRGRKPNAQQYHSQSLDNHSIDESSSNFQLNSTNYLEPQVILINQAIDDSQNFPLEPKQNDDSITKHLIEEDDEKSSQPLNKPLIDSSKRKIPKLKRQNFRCPNCPKSFDQKFSLQSHLRIHTGERPFHCTQCSKHFSHKHSYEIHLRTHSGERPHKCRHCDKSFAQLNTRNKHEQAMHLHVKPYLCTVCGHTSTVRDNVITHVRIVHFGLPKTLREQKKRNIVDRRDPRALVEKFKEIIYPNVQLKPPAEQ